MNRLVIIGNGFDLAHGLPTSYRSFLNWIWQNFSEVNSNNLFNNLFNINLAYFKLQDYKNYSDFCNYTKLNYQNPGYFISDSHYGSLSFKLFYTYPVIEDKSTIVFEFKNSFFELITVKNAENWVDIENTYYQVLLSIIKKDNSFPQIQSIDVLNSEFLQIKKLLENYLCDQIDNNYIFENDYLNSKDILDLFKFKPIRSGQKSNIFLEFPANYRNEIINFNREFSSTIISGSAHLIENLFVDFNYTKNTDCYVDLINTLNSKSLGKAEHIQIHGKISDVTNPINFGFGDEMDDHYKILENTGDNKFLENIKSFMYFNNSNYRKLLNWIESNDYQIFIMGHSCGLSDRTLLNTLFEHNNCKSIKVFYHQRPDGSDNFTELSQNISRHFNKKSMMREKVVDKSLSKPLPQNIRYSKK
ncbi:AbiH family protein [uncultured Chryseobacterium sp.]|uniref:AbiH family protein n=1 Tax=uncultured Chryseobacterium sp. TaxID=259322 RepID=UPI0025ECADFC|nr:AbiH family protein [uncultured Chryseobacterium sp.]